jgi:hypothetical protein
LRGFPLWQFDIGLRRQFKLSERLNLQLKVEGFNIFNHPNFADPAGLLGSFANNNLTPRAGFGESATMFGRSLGTSGSTGGFSPIYQVGGPRSLQFSARFSF